VNKVCPVTGLPIKAPVEWRYTTDDNHYRGQLYMVGDRIVVWKPSGCPRIEDAEAITELIYSVIDTLFTGNDRFFALFDYTELENPPIQNRLRVLKNLKETARRIDRVFFFGMNRTVRTIVRLSVQISGLADKIYICRDYADALSQVHSQISGSGEVPDFNVYQPREIRRLLEIIGTIVWNRDYSVEVPELTHDHPLSELYNAVDVMRHDLRMLDAENREKQEQLEEANRVKDNFIANISHEMKTPLGGILGSIELLHSTAPTELQQKYLRIMGHSSSVLMDRVNDVLDFSRMEHKLISLDRQVCSIRKICTDVAEMTIPQSAEKGIELFYSIDEGIPAYTLSDPIRLQQILINLLNNAVKFTDSGAIRLECSLVSKNADTFTCLFQVEDSGIGISPQQQEMIFGKFVQADTSSMKKETGSGLGLAIARELVHLFGGEIELVSSPHRGSIFSFTLSFPLVSGTNLFQDSDSREREFMGTVLVVDDDEINRIVIGDLVKNCGATPVPATSGTEALKKLSEQRIDLVLLDCSMPYMEGLEVAERIRSRKDAVGDVPVVAVTAYTSKEDRQTGMETVFDGYLSKPVRGADIQRVFDAFLPYTEMQNTEVQNSEKAFFPVSGPVPEKIMPLIHKQLAALPSQLDYLRECVEGGSFAEAGRVSHRLKSFSSTLLELPSGENCFRIAALLDSHVRSGSVSRSLRYIRTFQDVAESVEEHSRRSE